MSVLSSFFTIIILHSNYYQYIVDTHVITRVINAPQGKRFRVIEANPAWNTMNCKMINIVEDNDVTEPTLNMQNDKNLSIPWT